MTDCEDTPDAPVATLERLIDEFESAGESFRAEADANRDKRREADVGPEEVGGQADGETEFAAEPHLVVPHVAGAGDSPVARRSSLDQPAQPKLRSDAITVERVGGGPPVVRPNEEYEVSCTIRNFGGVTARATRVELYAEHLLPSRGALDTTNGVVEIEPERGLGDRYDGYEVSGTVSVAPDSKVSVFAHTSEPGEAPLEQVLAYSVDNEVSDGRTFTAYLDGRPDEYVDGTPVPEGTTEFTVEVIETTKTTPDEVDLTTQELFSSVPSGLTVATAPGRYVPGAGSPSDLQNHELASTVSTELTTSFDGLRYSSRPAGEPQFVSVPAHGERTVTLNYEVSEDEVVPVRRRIPETRDENPGIDPSDSPGIGQGVTVLYVRVNAKATGEFPENWDALDHTTSRFVGRTELPRINDDA